MTKRARKLVSQIANRKSPVRWLVLILLVGAIARVAAALYLGDEVVPVSGAYDQIFYHDLALNVLAGKGFVFTRPPWPFIEPGAPTAYYSFVYPLFLAAIYRLFGPHAVVARVIQALICALLPLQVYWLARLLADGRWRRDAEGPAGEREARAVGRPPESAGREARAVGRPPESAGREERAVGRPPESAEGGGAGAEAVALVAAGITAVYAYFVLYSASLQSEGVYLVLVAWALILTLKLAERPTWQRWLAWGVAVTLASEVRQVFMPMALLLLAYILAKAWRRIKLWQVALAGAAAAALILPFTIRNYRVFGTFLLYNSSAGQVFWNANHPDLGTHFIGDAMFPIPVDLEGANEAVLTNELMRRGWRLVLDDPWRFVQLSLSRAATLFLFWPSRQSSLVSNLSRSLSFMVCLPFMIGGLVLSLKEWRRWLLPYLFVAAYAGIHIISWAQIRYRMPVDVVLIVFAALAVVGTSRWLMAYGVRRMEDR